MPNRSFTINRLLLAFTGAMIGFGAIGQINDLSAQSKIAKNTTINSATAKNKVTNSPVAKTKLPDSATAKTKVTKSPIVTNRLPDSAKDLKQPQQDIFSKPLTFKTNRSIEISTKPDFDLVEAARNNVKIAQAAPTSNSPLIKIRPITPQTEGATIKPLYFPGLNAGTPTGFGLQTGDVFVGLFGSTAGKLRDTVDGSISVGTGLGNASEFAAVEGVFNLNSIRNFGSNGSFDLKVHKVVYEDFENQVGVAVGWTNFANYGSNAGGTPSSVYGVATLSRLTNPESLDDPKPLVISAGVGGGTYRNSNSSNGVGVFGSVGYLIDPQFGISTAYSGQGLNFAASFLPDRTLPLNISLTYADIINSSTAGTQIILGITYGANFIGRR